MKEKIKELTDRINSEEGWTEKEKEEYLETINSYLRRCDSCCREMLKESEK